MMFEILNKIAIVAGLWMFWRILYHSRLRVKADNLIDVRYHEIRALISTGLFLMFSMIAILTS